MKREAQPALSVEGQQALERYAYALKQLAQVLDVSPHDPCRFGYRTAEVASLHRLAQLMGHDSLDTTMFYIRGTKQDLQRDVEKIAWT
jgi:integrase/recombinase XerC